MLHVLVDQRMPREQRGKFRQLLAVRQFAVNNQISDLDKRRLFSELFDGNAAITQNTLVAVDETNRTRCRRGVHKRRVERHVSGLGAERRDVDTLLVLRPSHDRKLERLLLTVVFERELGRLLHASSFQLNTIAAESTTPPTRPQTRSSPPSQTIRRTPANPGKRSVSQNCHVI